MQEDDWAAHAHETISIQIDGLKALQATINGDFSQAVNVIRNATGRVIVSGVGKSGHIGRKIAATLASTGTPALFVHAGEAGHGDLGMIADNDIVIAISHSGESAEFQPLLQYSRRFGVFVIAITANPKSSLALQAELVLELPNVKEACPLNLAPMTSTTLTLVMGDALAAALIRARGFQRGDFAKFHPSGKLGAQFMRLSDVLAKRQNPSAMPKVAETASFADVIATITEDGRGVTAVVRVDTVVGVITDGDVRRALLSAQSLDITAGAMMSPDPLRIASDRLAVDGLALCQKHKVGALFVTEPHDETNVIGLVHLKDLVAMGLV
ncbi:MAG: KpsF/GutQ family sugar-phosphate isomerase [Pseudomonadota bacterium]